MVHLEVAAWFAQDNLKVLLTFFLEIPWPVLPSPPDPLLQGDNVTELRVKFLRKIEDTVPAGDD